MRYVFVGSVNGKALPARHHLVQFLFRIPAIHTHDTMELRVVHRVDLSRNMAENFYRYLAKWQGGGSLIIPCHMTWNTELPHSHLVMYGSNYVFGIGSVQYTDQADLCM